MSAIFKDKPVENHTRVFSQYNIILCLLRTVSVPQLATVRPLRTISHRTTPGQLDLYMYMTAVTLSAATVMRYPAGACYTPRCRYTNISRGTQPRRTHAPRTSSSSILLISHSRGEHSNYIVVTVYCPYILYSALYVCLVGGAHKKRNAYWMRRKGTCTHACSPFVHSLPASRRRFRWKAHREITASTKAIKYV